MDIRRPVYFFSPPLRGTVRRVFRHKGFIFSFLIIRRSTAFHLFFLPLNGKGLLSL